MTFEHPEPDLIDFMAPTAREALQALGRDVWDEALRYLSEQAAERPMRPAAYGPTRARFFGPSGSPADAPVEPSPYKDLLEEFRERVAPNVFNSQNAGSFSYFTPPPLPISIGAEVLGQWIQQGVDVWVAGPAGALIEEEVVSWLRSLIGYGEGTWGILTSGGVMANLMALTVARERHLPSLKPTTNPRGSALEGVRVYASDQAHFSIARALDILGFPPETLRVIDSDTRFRLIPAALEGAIAADRKAGLTPLAVSPVAGSTNTGAVDPIAEIADIAEREKLWMHVDAAYGGAVKLSERLVDLVPALDRADSVTIDPHKWFFQAYDIGGLLVKSREDLHRTFRRSPEYYRSARPEDEPLNWAEYSMEGTRRLRALKLWMSWKHLGTKGFGALVERTRDLAIYMSAALQEAGVFEVIAPELSVVCFRHSGGGDELQDRLQRQLEESGEGWVSTTKLRGKTFLRAGIVNYLSEQRDVDRMIAALVRLA